MWVNYDDAKGGSWPRSTHKGRAGCNPVPHSWCTRGYQRYMQLHQLNLATQLTWTLPPRSLCRRSLTPFALLDCMSDLLALSFFAPHCA